MNKIKTFSVVIAATMLMSMLASCSQSAKRDNIVKEDDPWYESTRFKLESDIQPYEQMGFSFICPSDDTLFSLYCMSKDMWGSSRTVLDSYDYDGNLTNRIELSLPDEYSIGSIYSAIAAADGKTINAIVHLTPTRNVGPQYIDIDTETGKVSVIKPLYSKEAKNQMRPESVTIDIITIGDYTIAKNMIDYKGGPIIDWQLLLFKDTEFVTTLDTSSLTLSDFLDGSSIDESTDTLYMVAEGENDELITMEFDIKNGKLKNKTNYEDADSKKINFAEYQAMGNGEMCKLDSLGNITKIDLNDMTPKTIIDTNWYTPCFYPDNDANHIFSSSILSCNEDRTVLLDGDSTIYGSDYVINDRYIRVLKKADKNPHAGKKVIKLALPPNNAITDYLSKAIYEFNKTDDEYLIRVWDKYKTGTTVRGAFGSKSEDETEVYTMIQDLKGGDAPDLVVGIQKTYAMRDNIFMDLTGFLDQDVMDKQFENIFEAGKFGGKQYFFPVTLEMEGLVTNSNLLKDGAVGITFDEFEKLIKENMNGFSPYDYPNSKANNKRTFILSCIDTKSAIEGESVEFGTDQFRRTVEYAKDNFEYDDAKSMTWEYITDWNRYRGECYYAKMDDYLDYVVACYNSRDKYSIIGTPSVDASGPRFTALDTISVSASTGVKDGCKKFLNYLFAGKAFESGDCAFRQIVTNKEIMAKNLETLTRLNNEGFQRERASIQSGANIPAPNYFKATGYKKATDDMRDSFYTSLSTISTYYYEDKEITKFIFEEIAPYFAEDRSIDDAIKFINDRATKYVKEM